MIELPRLEDGDVFEAHKSRTRPYERALKVALVADKSAHDFSMVLIRHTPEAALRRLYTELSTMENGHVEYLQSMLAAASGNDELHDLRFSGR